MAPAVTAEEEDSKDSAYTINIVLVIIIFLILSLASFIWFVASRSKEAMEHK